MDRDQDDYNKLPGCYPAWDLAREIVAGRRYRIVDVRFVSDGGALFAIYVAVVPGVV